MMQALLNAMRAQAQLVDGNRATVRLGLVTSYDPGNYCAKVRLQPEDVETGWLPVVSPWTGNGWGLFAPPTAGDLVEVQFQEGHIETGFICQRFYNDADRPLSVQSGEFWLVHASGSFLKFHNDGSVEVHSAQDLNATVGAAANLTVAGAVTGSAAAWNLTGDLTVTGNITASVDLFDHGAGKGSLQHVRDNYNTHTHPDAQGGNTGTPSNSL